MSIFVHIIDKMVGVKKFTYKYFLKKKLIKNINWYYFLNYPQNPTFFKASSRCNHKMFLGLNRFKIKEYQNFGLLPFKKI